MRSVFISKEDKKRIKNIVQKNKYRYASSEDFVNQAISRLLKIEEGEEMIKEKAKAEGKLRVIKVPLE